MTTSTSHRPRVRTAVAGLAIVLVLAVACSGPRSGASATTDVSGCAAVLPLARTIVHDQGTLTLIRRINQADADALARQFGIASTASPPPHSFRRGFHLPPGTRLPRTCLIVYQGNYPPGAITGASPPAVAGRYTLMVLRVRHPSIDRVLVTNRLPANLHHHANPFGILKTTW
ncbi:MAG: hypothetical protein JO287_24665 [Pseudonocardiales bacterium]|nr:hypothetical protein [Pseudonocardiales bacterium]